MVFCALSACGVSFKHLNYKKHPMVRLLYLFHVYYQVRRVLNTGCIASQFGLTKSVLVLTIIHTVMKGSSKFVRTYEVSHDPMRYRDEKFFGTHQHGVGRTT